MNNPTSITQDQFLTSLRYLIAAGGAYAAGKGWINSETINNLLVVASILGPLAWGLYVNWQKSQQVKKVAAVGVQAGIALAASGDAIDSAGNPISRFAADATPPKQVTLTTAPEIIEKYGPAPNDIAKV